MSCCLRRVQSEDPFSVTNKHSLNLEVVKELKGIMYSNDTSENVFETIMHRKNLSNTLKKWCINHYCPEMYDFVEAFKSWQKKSTLDGAQDIFNTYFTESAHSPIDIPYQYREKLSTALKNNDIQTAEVELRKCFSKVATELRNNFC